MKLSTFARLFRIHQWVKNLILFSPIFFSGELLAFDHYFRVLICFFAFCCVSSGVYVLNDLADIEADKLHPVKKDRPIAAGIISKPTAMVWASGLILTSFLLCYLSSTEVLPYVLAYLIINLLYSFYLKHVSIIDMALISLGFVIRVLAGGTIENIIISKWLILTTFLLALFLTVAKRRDDIILFNRTGEKLRKVVDGYNLIFLDALLCILTAVLIVVYVLYTTSAEVVQHFGSDKICYTSFFVVIGLMRYLQLSLVEEKSGNPTLILLKDSFIQATIAGWLFSFYYFIYLSTHF